MDEASLHPTLCFGLIALGVIIAVVLVVVSAPYGRHLRPGWGPRVSGAVGWIVMEAPVVLGFAWLFAQGRHRAELVPLVLAAAWLLHYIHRGLIYPLRTRTRGRQMPIVVVAMGFVFNTLNAYLNARWISHLGDYDPAWLVDPRFLVGIVLFGVGFVVNVTSDEILLKLRRSKDAGYAIPHGSLYRFVSCPNYLGEILEWTGWAIATWSLAGLAFAVFTACNLGPRAWSHHRWYRREFPDYPPSRRALIPFVL